jgi:hypothetical protein
MPAQKQENYFCSVSPIFSIMAFWMDSISHLGVDVAPQIPTD